MRSLRIMALGALLLGPATAGCSPSPAMRPSVARAEIPRPAARTPKMEQRCAGELCFPYAGER